MEQEAKEILFEKLKEMAKIELDDIFTIRKAMRCCAALWQTCIMQFAAVLIENDPEKIIKLINN
mgnify:CR=1 FL=1